jgi:hypothetical protein
LKIKYKFIAIPEVPFLLPLPSQSVLTEGLSFRLFCHSSGGTKPVFFQWSKNGINLNNKPESRYKIETFKDNSQFGIENVDRSDSGNYSCIAKNAFGSDTQSALLIVKGLIHFFYFSHSLNFCNKLIFESKV